MSSSTNRTSTQRPHLKVTNYKDHIEINPQRWKETSIKRDKTPKTKTHLLHQGITTPHQQWNKAWWRTTVLLTETGFRRWIIRNFWELKELVLTQCKETKNFEKRFDEILTRIDNIERNISELSELKNTAWELREVCTSFNSQIDQAEERISELEDQLNK